MLVKVNITETRTATVYVDVDYDFQAPDAAKQMYKKGIVTTDVDDVIDVKFEIAEDDDEEG